MEIWQFVVIAVSLFGLGIWLGRHIIDDNEQNGRHQVIKAMLDRLIQDHVHLEELVVDMRKHLDRLAHLEAVRHKKRCGFAKQH